MCSPSYLPFSIGIARSKTSHYEADSYHVNDILNYCFFSRGRIEQNSTATVTETGKKTKTNLWTNNKAIENLFLETLWNLYYALCLNSIKSGTIKSIRRDRIFYILSAVNSDNKDDFIATFVSLPLTL